MFYLIAVIGGVVNRIRGGWLTDILRARNIISYKDKVPYVKSFNDLSYAITFGLLISATWQGYIVLYLSMWLGRAPGWGGYLEAMIDKKINDNRDDVKLLDKWFRGNDEPILSGWGATSIRGLIWSSCLYAGLYVINYFGCSKPLSELYYIAGLLGLLMGSVYLFSMELCSCPFIRGRYYALTSLLHSLKIVTKPVYLGRGNGWQLGEVLFGAYLWGGVFLCVEGFSV